MALPTEYDAEADSIARRQKYAEMLRQQSMEPLQTNQMAGGYVVPVSPLSGLAKMLQAYSGRKGVERAETDRKSLQGRMDTERSTDMTALVNALRGQPARPQQFDPQEAEQSADQGTAMPMFPAVPGDPNQAAMIALGSRLPDVRQMAPGLMNIAETRQNRQEDRAFRGEQADAQRQFQMEQLRMRSEDQRLSQQERIAAQKQLAQMQIDARRELANQSNAIRRDIAAQSAAQAGRPPTGYRFTPQGNLEAIPGGPADIKAGAEGKKSEMRQQVLTDQADNVINTVGEAKKLVGYTTTGAGGLLANLPMTDARKLAGHVETIKANLGFDRLQQMRDMSPTGGALGQVAVQELNALRSTVAMLDQLQSPGDVAQALDKIEKHYTKWKSTLGGQTQGASGEWAVIK